MYTSVSVPFFVTGGHDIYPLTITEAWVDRCSGYEKKVYERCLSFGIALHVGGYDVRIQPPAMCFSDLSWDEEFAQASCIL